MNPEPKNPQSLFLIGYRCTGKSSVGKLLAAALSRSFVDTDSLVVSENGMSIREIVKILGWEAFRRLEHTALQKVCTMQRLVVATGGGVVLDAGNVKLMKESGRVIWLRATASTIKARMVQDLTSEGFRPALTLTDSISEIEVTLAEREPLYHRVMDFAVNTDNIRLDEIVNSILGNLKKLDTGELS